MTLLPAYFFFPIHDVQERLNRLPARTRIKLRKKQSYDPFSLNSQELFFTD